MYISLQENTRLNFHMAELQCLVESRLDVVSSLVLLHQESTHVVYYGGSCQGNVPTLIHMTSACRHSSLQTWGLDVHLDVCIRLPGYLIAFGIGNATVWHHAPHLHPCHDPLAIEAWTFQIGEDIILMVGAMSIQ